MPPIEMLDDVIDVLEGRHGKVDILWVSTRLMQLKSLLTDYRLIKKGFNEDWSIFDKAIDSLTDKERNDVSNLVASHAQKFKEDEDLIDKITRCLPKDFHPNVSLPARIMNLWQYYEAEVNKNKSLQNSSHPSGNNQPVEAEEILKRSVAKALNINMDAKDWYIHWWFLLDPQPSLKCILRAMEEYASLKQLKQ